MIHFKKYGVLYAILFVFAMWLLTPSLVNLFAPTGTDQIASRGQYGDMYGYVTSLFSGLTIIGLVYTIIQQHEDLRIARESLKEQKNELVLTRGVAEGQSKTIQLQRFENTFFKMLELQNSITSELIYTHRHADGAISGVTKGKGVIRYEREELLKRLGKESGDTFDELQARYEGYDNVNHTQFDRYLSNLDTINDYIVNSSFLSIEEKVFYLNIFALQLDDHELAYYFYFVTFHLKKTKAVLQHQELDIMKYVNPIFIGNNDHYRFFDPHRIIRDSTVTF